MSKFTGFSEAIKTKSGFLDDVVGVERLKSNSPGHKKNRELVIASELFDEEFYVQQIKRLPYGMTALDHFILYGVKNKASPSQDFNSNAYLACYRDVREGNVNPLLHYLKHGKEEGRKKFSVKQGSTQTETQEKTPGADKISKSNHLSLIQKSIYFDEDFYFSEHEELLDGFSGTPAEHYIEVGMGRGLQPSLYFDPEYYTKKNKDIASSEIPPLIHYIKFGKAEGRSPSLAVSQLPGHVLQAWLENPGTLTSNLSLWCEFKQAEKEKQWSRAESRLRSLLEQGADDAVFYNQLAHMLRKQGKWWQEIEALNSAIELEEHHATWYYRLGEAQEVMNHFQEAAAAFGKAIEIKGNKTDAEWHFRQGYCYAREGKNELENPRLAKKSYQQAIAKDTKYNAKRFGIGVFHQKRGHWVQAREAYLEQIGKTPFDADLLYRLGMAYDRCFEWGEAEKYYKGALSLEIGQPKWHYRLGFVLERQGNYIEAAKSYQYAALNRSPRSSKWFYRWGYALEQQKRFEEAVNAYLKVQLQQALNDSSEVEAGSICTETIYPHATILGEASSAGFEVYESKFCRQRYIIDTLTNILRKDTTNHEFWYQLGNAYERLHLWSKAAASYEHAVARTNNHSPALYYRWGYVLAQRGEFKKAAKAFRETRIQSQAYEVVESKQHKEPAFLEGAVYLELSKTNDIQENIVFFESFNGIDISCNPYAIFLELLNNKNYDDCIFVWVVGENCHIRESLKSTLRIIFVKKDSYLYQKYLVLAKYIICNSKLPSYFSRREGQKYLNTWHGTPLKVMGKDNKNDFMEFKNAQRNFLHATHILSPNKHTTWALIDRFDVSGIISADVFEAGYPRIDLTINSPSSYKAKLKSALKIPDGKKVILYAPTWRGRQGLAIQETQEIYNEVEELKKSGAFILFKGHYFVNSSEYGDLLSEITVPNKVNVNELLSIVDVLVTDYSSIAIDFMVTGNPIIHYVKDYDEYVRERGLYFSKDELPGHVVQELSQLSGVVRDCLSKNIDTPKTYEKLKEEFCLNEDGNASKRVVDWFFCSIDTKSKALNGFSLIYPGLSYDKQTKHLFLNVIKMLEFENKKPIVIIDNHSISKSKIEFLNSIRDRVQLLSRVGRMPLTIEEDWVRRKNNDITSELSSNWWKVMEKAYKRELLRLTGEGEFEEVINIDCYSNHWTKLLSVAKSNSKSIFFDIHNSRAYESIYPHVFFNRYLYREYEKHIFPNSQAAQLFTRTLNLPDSSKTEILSPGYPGRQESIYIAKRSMQVVLNKISVDDDFLSITGGLILKEKGRIRLLKVSSFLIERRPRGNDKNKIYEFEALESELKGEKHVFSTSIRYKDKDLAYLDCFLAVDVEFDGAEILRLVLPVRSTSKNIFDNVEKNPFEYAVRHDDYVLYPYFTAGGNLAFLNRPSSEYDGNLYIKKEEKAHSLYDNNKVFYDNLDIVIVFDKFSRGSNDNGFYFFENAVEKQGADNYFFLLDRRSPSYPLLKTKYGKQVIEFMSIKHMVYLLAAKTIISSEARVHAYAWRRVFGVYRDALFNKRFVFLQHGVLGFKNVSEIFSKYNRTFSASKFVVSSRWEKNLVCRYFHYNENDVIVSGLPRWDDEYDFNSLKNEIFVMPTWRSWLEDIPLEEFLESDYFIHYIELLASPKLHSILKTYGFNLVFCAHPKISRYFIGSKINSPLVKIIDAEENPIRNNLVKAKLLITDYSSVAWDFIFFEKPVLFYHFDLDRYEFSQGSYLDLRQDMPGSVAYDEDGLINNIEHYLKNYNEKLISAELVKTKYFGDLSNINSHSEVIFKEIDSSEN